MTVKTENLLNNAIFFFFALFLFSSSFSIALSQASFGLSMLLFIILSIMTRYNPFQPGVRNIYFAIFIFLAWMVVSCLVNKAPIGNLREEWLFCIIPVGIFLFRQKHYRMLLASSLAIGVILVSLYGIVQHFFGINWFKDYPLPPARDDTFYATGGFSNSMTYGNYLAVAAMFLVSLGILRSKTFLKSLNSVFIFAGVLGLIGTVLSYSRTAVASLPLGILALAWLKGRKWVLVSILILVSSATLTFLFVEQLSLKYQLALERDLAGEHDSSRLFIWKKSLKLTLDNPVFGVGQGNFEKEYQHYLDSANNETHSRPHAHNDILNFAAVAGFPGAIFFICIWVILFYKLHKIWHGNNPFSDKQIFAGASAVAGFVFIVASITEATFADEEVRQILMALWAAGLWPLVSKNIDDDTETDESA